MTTPIRKVLDISHHNEVTDWDAVKAAGIRGIIHKATEGIGYTDPNYQLVRADALSHGLLWGAYHFATDSDPEGQADFFLNETGVDDAMLYCLDWEDYGSDTMSESQARTFMQEIDYRTGADRCVLYSGNTAKDALGADEDDFFGRHRYWLAQYGSNPVEQPSWDSWWLWQYSDGEVGPAPQGCPGVNGAVDTNSWEGTDAELAAQWSGLTPRPPRPGPRPPRANVVSIRTFGKAIVLVNGHVVAAEPTRRRPRWDRPPRGL